MIEIDKKKNLSINAKCRCKADLGGKKRSYGKYLLFIYIYVFLFITYFLGVIIYFHFSGVLVP